MQCQIIQLQQISNSYTEHKHTISRKDIQFHVTFLQQPTAVLFGIVLKKKIGEWQAKLSRDSNSKERPFHQTVIIGCCLVIFLAESKRNQPTPKNDKTNIFDYKLFMAFRQL